jgi:hypothetical protein
MSEQGRTNIAANAFANDADWRTALLVAHPAITHPAD